MYVRRRVSGNNGREVCFLQFRQKTRAARVTSSRRETRARPSPSHRHMRCEARHERVYSLLVLLLTGPRRRCPYAYAGGTTRAARPGQANPRHPRHARIGGTTLSCADAARRCRICRGSSMDDGHGRCLLRGARSPPTFRVIVTRVRAVLFVPRRSQKWLPNIGRVWFI